MAVRILLIVVFVLTSCDRGADPQAREKELAYLRVVMPEDLLPYAHVEVPAVENIAILGEGADRHLGLHTIPGQKRRSGGVRAEVSVDRPFEEGDTLRYEWQFRVPEDFKSDAPRNRWCIIGQWHDQPDIRQGETWEGFPSRSPPVLVGLGEWQGRLALGIEYGPTQAQKHGPIFIQRGKWHRIAMVIRWSRKADGRASVYFDDMTTAVKTFDGPNMHNGYQHYFKFGMYRHPDIATENWIHLREFKTSKVAPQPSPGQ
ncbi:polysaccharide lyase [Brevifollis gellanilyticus]|uniref:Polysaccharide lyase n=1 Tax=Brevifollis gellanilyticus TaxID=748831 RepID=A0A512M9C4_9BACT|nr:polysaccharide lyase [Brevifollis gellanilyticus]GEP42941.1 hypothetical protein BGE01nite_22320 [Brevifollis gellanilyticus]